MTPSSRIFVNVSCGAIVDTDDLMARLKRGDVVARSDVFDPGSCKSVALRLSVRETISKVDTTFDSTKAVLRNSSLH